VKAVTLAGGGEPTMNRHLPDFIRQLTFGGIKVGLITNGVYQLPIDSIILLDWIGVSVDAGTSETWASIKNVSPLLFDEVVENIKTYSKYNQNTTYKFLITPDNYKDLKPAIKLFKKTSAKYMQIRPMGTTWFEDKKSLFGVKEIRQIKTVVENNTTRNDNIFMSNIKVDERWRINNDFGHCWSAFMTLVIQPNGILVTCCDRRGDDKVTLAKGIQYKDIPKYWGSERHRNIFKDIDPKQCCRCTFKLHNQIYEHCVLQDSMTLDFI
jgi:MoaA/NifB/PqqE/SkfB family radical SAM enzyme